MTFKVFFKVANIDYDTKNTHATHSLLKKWNIAWVTQVPGDPSPWASSSDVAVNLNSILLPPVMLAFAIFSYPLVCMA